MKVKKDCLLSVTKLFNWVHCINYRLYTALQIMLEIRMNEKSQISVWNTYLKVRFLHAFLRKSISKIQLFFLIVTSNQPAVYWYFIDGYSKRTHKNIFCGLIYRFFSMFLHMTFLQLMSVPLKLCKNSLGLERSALIKISFLYTVKIRKPLYHATIFFCSQTLEPTRLKRHTFPKLKSLEVHLQVPQFY